MKGTAIFTITSWQETIYAEMEDGANLTRASIQKKYTGAIEGSGVLEYLMSVRSDGNARFMGYEFVTGTIDERYGTFVFQHNGEYESGKMHQESMVLPGSATGGLVGLQGTANITAEHQQEYPMEFEYEFD